MAQSYESDGTPAGRNLYAYCLMSNHIHLLIREREDTLLFTDDPTLIIDDPTEIH